MREFTMFTSLPSSHMENQDNLWINLYFLKCSNVMILVEKWKLQKHIVQQTCYYHIYKEIDFDSFVPIYVQLCYITGHRGYKVDKVILIKRRRPLEVRFYFRVVSQQGVAKTLLYLPQSCNLFYSTTRGWEPLIQGVVEQFHRDIISKILKLKKFKKSWNHSALARRCSYTVQYSPLSGKFEYKKFEYKTLE